MATKKIVSDSDPTLKRLKELCVENEDLEVDCKNLKGKTNFVGNRRSFLKKMDDNDRLDEYIFKQKTKRTPKKASPKKKVDKLIELCSELSDDNKSLIAELLFKGEVTNEALCSEIDNNPLKKADFDELVNKKSGQLAMYGGTGKWELVKLASGKSFKVKKAKLDDFTKKYASMLLVNKIITATEGAIELCKNSSLEKDEIIKNLTQKIADLEKFDPRAQHARIRELLDKIDILEKRGCSTEQFDKCAKELETIKQQLNDHKALPSLVGVLTKQVSQLLKEKDELVGKLGQLEKLADEYKNTQDSMKQVVVYSRDEVKKDGCEKLEAEVRNLKSVIETGKEMLKKCNRSPLTIMQDVSDTTRIKELENQLREKTSELAERERSMKELERRIKENTEKLAANANEMNRYKQQNEDRIRSNKQNESKLKSEIDVLKQKLEKEQQEKGGLIENLNATYENVEAMRGVASGIARIDELNKQLTAKDKLIEDLERKIETKDGEIKLYKQQNADRILYHKQEEPLNDRLERLNEELEREKQEKQDLIEQLKAKSEQSLDSGTSVIDKLNQDLTEKYNIIFQKEEIIKDLERKIAEMGFLRENNRILQENMNDAFSSIKALENELEKIKSSTSIELELLRSKLDECEKQKMDYVNKLTLCDENGKKLVSKAKDFDNLVEENAQLKQKIEKLKAKVDKFKSPMPVDHDSVKICINRLLGTD